MSLIVARKNVNNIVIMSDTKLTYNDGVERNKITSGTIKTVIIGNEINLSFAGRINYAEKVFKWLEENQKKIDLNDLISVLKIANERSDLQTEFILCIGDKDIEHTKIIEVKDGKVSDVSSAWIGSGDAFNKYQESFHRFDKKNIMKLFGGSETSLNIIKLPSDNMEFNECYLKNFYAMNEVIEDLEIEEVDGFIVASIYTNGSFKYMGYAYCFPLGFNKKVELKNISSEKPYTLPLGSKENGAYAVSVSDGSRIALPIFLPHGEVGIIYKRNKSGLMEPNIYNKISYDAFKTQLSDINIRTNFVEIDIKNNCFGINDKQ